MTNEMSKARAIEMFKEKIRWILENVDSNSPYASKYLEEEEYFVMAIAALENQPEPLGAYTILSIDGQGRFVLKDGGWSLDICPNFEALKGSLRAGERAIELYGKVVYENRGKEFQNPFLEGR